jgi:hypothetical protein
MNINNKDIEVDEVRNDWALALMTKGVIAKLTMTRWRGIVNLTPDDLGIKFANENNREIANKYIDYGRQRLLPPEIDKELSGIETKARNNLKAYSFNTLWGSFIPFTAFDEWEKENEKIRTEYFSFAEQMSNSYNSIVQTIRNAYSNIAIDVWFRLNNDNSPTSSFINHFTNKITEKIPSKFDILTSFKYDVNFLTIPIPSIIEDNLYKAEKIKQKKELEILESAIEKNTKEKIAQMYIEKKQDLIDNFLNSTVKSLRSHVSELCQNVLDSIISENKEISKSKKEKIQRTIDHVKILNFYDDEEILKHLNLLNNELDKFKGERDYDTINLNLKKIINLASQDIRPNINPILSNLDIDI